MIKILILCTGNSCRSQMAHGILDSLLNKKATVFSAGVAPEKVNPYAVSVMKMIGIDISEYKSNHVSEYSEVFFDYVFTVCDSAKDKCPVHFKARKIIGLPQGAVKRYFVFPAPYLDDNPAQGAIKVVIKYFVWK